MKVYRSDLGREGNTLSHKSNVNSVTLGVNFDMFD